MAKRTWLDGQVGNTPITAARLNDLEEDVETALSVAVANATPYNIGLDVDGTPYYDPGASGISLQADTDGVPYFV